MAYPLTEGIMGLLLGVMPMSTGGAQIETGRVDLVEILAGAHITWSNVNNTPPYQMAKRREILDLTFLPQEKCW